MEYKITEKRNRRIKDAIKSNISEIIIGYNKGFKTNNTEKIQRRVNQNFIQIPLSKIKERIKRIEVLRNSKKHRKNYKCRY